MDYAKEIQKLKKEKNAVILAHYYTYGEVQDVADFVGDSLALSEEAAATDADIIVFAGVNFMAETAKVLSPQKKVLLPDLEAGCSLAESCPVDGFREFKARYPGYKVVSYVNTTVGIKALTDICCTSTNALKVINSIPVECGIIFAPDRNLGAYLKNMTGRDNMVIWDGACHVHEKFSLDGIKKLKAIHPDAPVVAHPECKAAVLETADFVGSTSAILNFCSKDPSGKFIVVTEPGIIHRMKRDNPGKTFIPAPSADALCGGCNDCEYMKMNDLKKIYECLMHETPEITIPENERKEALGSIVAMLEISRQALD